ncbi:MAG: chemotaxis protein CheC [Planctomycetes bacterium]|nr:chemotaxis protein CheC [Planctomycetota bacterium]
MNLTEMQADALKEIMNIGVSKSATQLSALLIDEIRLEVPEVSILTPAEVNNALFINSALSAKGEESIVYQELMGMLAGRAYLIFRGEDSKFLSQAVLGNAFSHAGEKLQFYEQEAVMEIGNIIISSCIASVANILKGKIVLSTPVYTEDSLPQILSKMANDMVVLVVKTALCASKRDITGTLVIVITSEMVDSLIRKLSEFCDFTGKDVP